MLDRGLITDFSPDRFGTSAFFFKIPPGWDNSTLQGLTQLSQFLRRSQTIVCFIVNFACMSWPVRRAQNRLSFVWLPDVCRAFFIKPYSSSTLHLPPVAQAASHAQKYQYSASSTRTSNGLLLVSRKVRCTGARFRSVSHDEHSSPNIYRSVANCIARESGLSEDLQSSSGRSLSNLLL